MQIILKTKFLTEVDIIQFDKNFNFKKILLLKK